MSDASPRFILEQHREWLGSGGRAGRQASLNGAVLAGGDFRGAKLARADLRGTNLAGADLSGADLSTADLEAADLANANLEGADLAGANLRRCNLQGCRLRGVKGLARAALHDVNLQGATGLDGTEFAGADLAGARMPELLSFEGRLSYVAETSQNARPVFLSILLSCVFIVLTVASTPDAALLSNASLAVLPDLATNIPATSFFFGISFQPLVVSSDTRRRRPASTASSIAFNSACLSIVVVPIGVGLAERQKALVELDRLRLAGVRLAPG